MARMFDTNTQLNRRFKNFSPSDTDECASLPCQNGGTCVDGVDLYTCSCLPGYEGEQCQTSKSACHLSSICVIMPIIPRVRYSEGTVINKKKEKGLILLLTRTSEITNPFAFFKITNLQNTASVLLSGSRTFCMVQEFVAF